MHVFKSMIYFGKRAAFTDTLVVLRRITANHFRLFHLHAKMRFHKVDSSENRQERIPLAAAGAADFPDLPE